MSESTNKAGQRESGYYWATKDGASLILRNIEGMFFYQGFVFNKDYFDEIDERPIQRHQPEILSECLEALEESENFLIQTDSVAAVPVTLIDKLESCISKLKSLI